MPKQKYDLEERTFIFAKECREFIKMVPKSLSNIEDGIQLIRSSGSVGANYIEANEALSKKDFTHRAKICRKEAKESRFWLKLVEVSGKESKKLENKRQHLIQEATEIMMIFGSIIQKVK